MVRRRGHQVHYYIIIDCHFAHYSFLFAGFLCIADSSNGMVSHVDFLKLVLFVSLLLLLSFVSMRKWSFEVALPLHIVQLCKPFVLIVLSLVYITVVRQLFKVS